MKIVRKNKICALYAIMFCCKYVLYTRAYIIYKFIFY